MIETHIEKRSRVAGITEEDIDHDKVAVTFVIGVASYGALGHVPPPSTSS